MLISVVIPAHDAESTLPDCLAALRASTYPDVELIVVDDASADDTASVARDHGARLVRLDDRRGPARARNAGALASHGELLVFVDADVCVHPTALARFAARFTDDAELAAAFGSYDDDPAARSFVSRYRNLLHHFVHHRSAANARTFWAGCGAVRRAAFAEVGGFNERYADPSIEDIELGQRIHRAGGSILLDPSILCTHLKRWKLGDMVLTDIRRRAVPWGRLLFREREIPADLNLRWSHRASALTLWAGLAAAIAALVWPPAIGRAATVAVVAIVVLTALVLLNRSLYAFFRRRCGWWFAARAVPVHALYYLYSSAALVWAAITMGRAPRLEGSLTARARRAMQQPLDRSEPAT